MWKQSNQQRALHAKHNTAMRRLLVSLELYKEQNGVLAPTLEELRKSDTRIQDIAVSEYTYAMDGIVAGDGSRWLLAVSDPLGANKIIVGRLPVEITVKAKKGSRGIRQSDASNHDHVLRP